MILNKAVSCDNQFLVNIYMKIPVIASREKDAFFAKSFTMCPVASKYTCSCNRASTNHMFFYLMSISVTRMNATCDGNITNVGYAQSSVPTGLTVYSTFHGGESIRAKPQCKSIAKER